MFPSQRLVSIVAESVNKLVGSIKLQICVTCQQYQVVATETVNPVALEANIECAIATEKLDGTCCYVTIFEGNLLLFCYTLIYKNVIISKIHFLLFQFRFTAVSLVLSLGRPHLWARLDRKPNKQAEKRFKKYQHSHRSCKGFVWNVEDDFKTVPATWIPAHRVKHDNGHPVPDEHGHIPGGDADVIHVEHIV